MAANPEDSALELTQEEVWDDTTLVQAWDEALDEYKKYHSIAATGEDAEMLMAAEEGPRVEETEKGAEQVVKTEKVEEQLMEEMKDAPDAPVEEQQQQQQQQQQHQQQHQVAQHGQPEGSEAAAAPLEVPAAEEARPEPEHSAQQQQPAFPFAQQHPTGPAGGFAIGGNDEVMRNLMMSWYWAGYYTGLQEGQQKALQQQQQQ